MHIWNMKTVKSHRPIQLSKNITEHLKNQIAIQKQQAELLGEDYAQNDFLFKQEDGSPVNPNVYSKAFKRCLRAYNQQADAKLPDISLYSAARHSFGTNLIVNENIPTSIVSSIMGNSERVLTERYVHVANSSAKCSNQSVYRSEICMRKYHRKFENFDKNFDISHFDKK